MKFIIADDEPIVREGLKTLINWSEMGFTLCDEAADGNEAVAKILKHNPDLVILDIKMPELSGIEVVEAVRQKDYTGKIIILSGFSDFTYAQTAIRLGVECYLLKPVDEDELIAALKKVKGKKEQENILELYNKQSLPDTKNMLLKHILTGSFPGTCKDFDSMGLSLNILPLQLVMLDYSTYNDINMIKLRDYWKNLYQDSKSEFIIIDNSIILLIQGLPSVQYFVDYVLSYMNKAVQDNFKRPFVIISDIFNEINDFPVIYQKLKSISNRRFFYYEEDRPILSKDLEYSYTAIANEKLSPIEFIESIYKAILDKDTVHIDLTVKKLYQVLRHRDFTIEQTFQVLINCILQLKTLLNQTYIKELIEFNETELINEICNCRTLYQIINLLNVRFTSFGDNIKKPSDVNIIERVLNYIDVHYNEDLKLEKLAELFGYNTAYLGRLLSFRIGTNFNLYIEKKRLDKAIDMLINTDIKIQDISLLIGYVNVEYFYRKFKKYTKLTPGNYRAQYYARDIECHADLL